MNFFVKVFTARFHEQSIPVTELISFLSLGKRVFSAKGYQTVRGEAQLVDDSDYQKSRSVYDEEKPQETTESQSTKGSLPKGWKPE